jgi:hypothetical protein
VSRYLFPSVEACTDRAIAGHEPNTTPQRGHAILVAMPHEGARPSYRAYLVAKDEPAKARDVVGRHLLPDEIAYTLAAFPDVVQQIPELEPGGVMRL